MSLVIYDSKERLKKEFVPLVEGQVKMYVCGPTVYDFLHVGNFRGAVLFNLVRNWLEKKGFRVTYVYNYTDVDDRIIQKAQTEGVSPSVISERYIKEFESDYKALGLKPQSANPRVTEHMQSIESLIEELIRKERAYVVDGDVYFDVKKFENYGSLSHRKLEDLEAGFRIDVDSRKRHTADFALWKKAKPGEVSWPSPWSEGRPGWHIECSAMIRVLLGETIDIHGGGLDLLFPHHENEVAQSEGATDKPFVRYWMHNNMLNFGNQKMSKSVGNIRTARSFMSEYNAEILKFMLISVHYRSTSDFSETTIESAIGSLAKFYSSLAFAERCIKAQFPLVPLSEKMRIGIEKADDDIEKALDDDFNTPEMFAALFEVLRTFNNLARTPGPMTADKRAIAETYYSWLRSKGQLLALFQEEPKSFLVKIDDMLLLKKNVSRSDVDSLVKDRSEARLAKDFAKADQVRARLTELGIAVQDTSEGTEWEVQK